MPVSFFFYKYGEDLDQRVTVFPSLDPEKYPQAPRSGMLGFVHGWNIPYEVSNLDQFQQWFEQSLQQYMPKIQEEYAEYIESFPFGDEEMESAQAGMEVILGYLANGIVDTPAFKQKLMDMGYLRPSKRQGRPSGMGMVPEQQTVYVLDHKKIVDDAYGARNRHDPESFYTVMAYYLHRLKKNISSWTDMMLTTFINDWHDTANRFGLDMDWREVQAFFDTAARRLYQNIFKSNAPRSRVDQTADFYNWFNGGSEEPRYQSEQASGSLEDFAQFVQSIGGDPEMARSDPKRAYRQMALKWHPDRNKDPNAHNTFVQLQNAWEKVKPTIAASMNWLQKVAYGKGMSIISW